jgi:hypothetical protein
MKYQRKRQITTVAVYATIITALIAIIKQYTIWGAIAFAVVSVASVIAYISIENKHMKEK